MRGVGNAPYILMIPWTSPYILKHFCRTCTNSYLDRVGSVVFFILLNVYMEFVIKNKK